jgi:hypothetical protein
MASTEEHDRLCTSPPPVPRAVRIVGWLFVVFGILGLTDMAVSLVEDDHVILNLDFLGLFVGMGVLRLQQHWRRWALVLLCLEILLMLLALIVLPLWGRPNASWLRMPVRERENLSLLAFAVVAFMLSLKIWQYRVLRKPAVRELFDWHAYRQANTGERRFIDSLAFALAAIVLVFVGEFAWCQARTTHGREYVVAGESFSSEEYDWFTDHAVKATDAFLRARGILPTTHPAGDFFADRSDNRHPLSEAWYLCEGRQPLYVRIARGPKDFPEFDLSVWQHLTDFRPRVAAEEARFDQLVKDLRAWWEQYEANHPLHPRQEPAGQPGNAK